MVFTEEQYLPTEEELTVQEVNLSGPALRAGAFHLGKSCEWENNVRLYYLIKSNQLQIVSIFRNICYANRNWAIQENV